MAVKLFSLLIVLFSITAIQAQEVEWNSNTVVGGSVSFSHQSFGNSIGSFVEDQKNSSFAFSPYLAKELSPRTMLGLRPVYRRSTTSFNAGSGGPDPSPTVSSFVNRAVGVGLFLRHMLNLEGRFRFYLEYQAGYEATVQTFDGIVQGNGNSTNFAVSPGLYYLLSSRFRILLRGQGLSYRIDKSENNPVAKSFRADVSFEGLQFGAEYVF